MSIKLSELAFSNFRSFSINEELENRIQLEEFTCLLGYNNAGKSNILSGIGWLVSPSKLSRDQFNESDKPITIAGKITGISDEVLATMESRHKERIEPYIHSESLTIKQTQESPTASPKLSVLKPEEDWSKTESWAANPTGISNALKVLFPEPILIGAMENVTDDIGKTAKKSNLSKLIELVTEPVMKTAELSDVAKALDTLRNSLESNGDSRLDELKELDSSMSGIVGDFFPGISVRLHIPSPGFSECFKNGTLKISEHGIRENIDIGEMGHGSQRCLQMALVRLLSQKRASSSTGPSKILLLIEEPELYLHPQAIELTRQALKSLANNGFQVIVCTHSNQLIIDVDDIQNTLLVTKRDTTGTKVSPRLRETIEEVFAENKSQGRLLLRQDNAKEILFNHRVLLCEGKTEARVLPEICKQVTEKSFLEHRLGFVPATGSGDLWNSKKVLSAIGLNVKIIADLDYGFKQAPKSQIVDGQHEVFTRAKAAFVRLSQAHGFELGGDGYPRNAGQFTAAKGFALLAEDEEGKEIIDELHPLLKSNGIWIWKKGTSEAYTGLTSKKEDDWDDWIAELKLNGDSHICHLEEVREVFDWIIS